MKNDKKRTACEDYKTTNIYTMKKLELHWKILIGMVLGLVFGFVMLQIDGGKEFSE